MNRKILLRAVLVGLATFVSYQAHAVGEGTGNIVGSLKDLGSGTYTVNATDSSTGRSRTININPNGDFRFSQLPVGQYNLIVSRDGTIIARDNFGVTLNGNTLAVFPLADQDVELDEIIVTASATTGDVYSTDSGVVLGKDEIDILPVTGISSIECIRRLLTKVVLNQPSQPFFNQRKVDSASQPTHQFVVKRFIGGIVVVEI